MALAQAQTQKMYIMKSGNVVGQYEAANVDSILGT